MNRKQFQELSNLRRREAKALLDRRMYPGAYYLMGYSIECALKACIAKRTERHDFPDKNLVQKAYTHNLAQLVALAELKQKLDESMKADRRLELNWQIVKDWQENSRYNPTCSKTEVRDFYNSCVARTYGVLSWLKKQW